VEVDEYELEKMFGGRLFVGKHGSKTVIKPPAGPDIPIFESELKISDMFSRIVQLNAIPSRFADVAKKLREIADSLEPMKTIEHD
jgi:hypothetical protein